MKIVEVKPREIDLKGMNKRFAKESDCSTVYNEDVLFTQDGVPIILYKKLETDTNDIRWAVQNIKYESSTRTAGLKSTSAIFGYSPKVALRKDFCSATAMANKFPKAHYVICKFAEELTKLYEEYFPEILAKHYDIVTEKVLDDWKIEGTPFTSGIVNKNNQLKYHHDAGNFKGVLSNMLVLKNKVKGGRLACPEFDFILECADDHVVIFNGQNILHGVTPIQALSKDSYRYTVVYYSLEQMWKCEGVNEELKRIRTVRQGREKKRAAEPPKEKS